jgi:hypothetical protein
MNRAPGSLLMREDTAAGDLVDRQAAPEPDAKVLRALLLRVLAAFGHSCALVGVAMLGCLALVAVGTIGSLAWTFLVDR